MRDKVVCGPVFDRVRSVEAKPHIPNGTPALHVAGYLGINTPEDHREDIVVV